MAQRKPTQVETAEPARMKSRRADSLPIAWSRTAKWGISAIVVVQLLAVVAEPFRFFTRSSRGTSPMADPVRIGLAPYIEFAYLNHGYFFFAPEPGPSHLMECRMTLPDERQVSLIFPDKTKQWPRLLYHRHFMLAEFLHQLHVPPYQAEVAGNDDRFARDWQAERAVFESVRDSMSQHLAAKYGALSASLQRLEHRLPSDDEVFRQRIPLDSPTLYIALPDAPFIPPPADPLLPRPLSPLSPPAGQPLFRPGQGVLRDPAAALAPDSVGEGTPSAPRSSVGGAVMPQRNVPVQEIKP